MILLRRICVLRWEKIVSAVLRGGGGKEWGQITNGCASSVKVPGTGRIARDY